MTSHTGMGGSYRKEKDGSRALIERTAEEPIAAVPQRRRHPGSVEIIQADSEDAPNAPADEAPAPAPPASKTKKGR